MMYIMSIACVAIGWGLGFLHGTDAAGHRADAIIKNTVISYQLQGTDDLWRTMAVRRGLSSDRSSTPQGARIHVRLPRIMERIELK